MIQTRSDQRELHGSWEGIARTVPKVGGPRRIGPSAGEAGAEVQYAGREEKTDTPSILVVGHQFPSYIMVYEAPQLVCSRGMAGRTCEAVEALVINNSAALAFCSAPPTVWCDRLSERSRHGPPRKRPLLKDIMFSGCPVSTDYHLFAATAYRPGAGPTHFPSRTRGPIVGHCCSAVSSSRHGGFVESVRATARQVPRGTPAAPRRFA
jgi:hypothetical protein